MFRKRIKIACNPLSPYLLCCLVCSLLYFSLLFIDSDEYTFLSCLIPRAMRNANKDTGLLCGNSRNTIQSNISRCDGITINAAVRNQIFDSCETTCCRQSIASFPGAFHCLHPARSAPRNVLCGFFCLLIRDILLNSFCHLPM